MLILYDNQKSLAVTCGVHLAEYLTSPAIVWDKLVAVCAWLISHTQRIIHKLW